MSDAQATDQQLRRDIVAQAGLPPSAASLISGSTLAELESSAQALAELVAARVPDTEQAPEQNPLVAAFAPGLKRARQRALVEMLHPTSQRPRDPRTGQFAPGRSISFDGGARTPTPTQESPLVAHDRVVAELAALSRLGRSQF
jgi:hypothetical protein